MRPHVAWAGGKLQAGGTTGEIRRGRRAFDQESAGAPKDVRDRARDTFTERLITWPRLAVGHLTPPRSCGKAEPTGERSSHVQFESPRFQGDQPFLDSLNDPDTGNLKPDPGMPASNVRRHQAALSDLTWTPLPGVTERAPVHGRGHTDQRHRPTPYEDTRSEMARR
jgi:hypothetical protein